MGQVRSITTHTCVTSVEQRRLREIFCVVEPVPIWLVTLVTALFTKCCLVGVGYVPVPCQEVALMGDIQVNNGRSRPFVVQLSDDSQFHGSRVSD